MFFTRLPLWRIHQPPQDAFRHVVGYWPFVGWLTGGTMALTFWLASSVLPLSLSLLLAIGARMLLTGALHEDGLADFCDGMGGGNSRERILAIMKDSHIGTYGVLGLFLYLLLLHQTLCELPALGLLHIPRQGEGILSNWVFAAILLSSDVWSKACASLLVGQLPYARTEEEAKARVAYTPLQWGRHTLRILLALLPAAVLWSLIGRRPPGAVFLTPLLIEGLLSMWIRKRLGGYTGDCCGATFLICEATMYLTWIICL